ncbi:hypothetical protein FB550_1074 [Neobacillus bataviensis]|uniref:Uncharacterized protein n=1 Tax=Neobacillus bataviensis TaxID=220685 RepID=A0A561D7F7_9BACI|nr:hypothetical protein [Neobacillus bataviensis]TWD99369.1 hypothetical protein FB550_1074 [Neobacillus bataviensis]
MSLYEKLPDDLLICFFNEVTNNIEKGILTKNTYFELGMIISVANRRGIDLIKLHDFNKILPNN